MPEFNRSLRQCLGHFATGVVVVTYATPEGERGVTVNSFASVSLDPPLILVCLDKRSKAASRLPDARFAVNVLRSDQSDLALQFAGLRAIEVPPRWHRAGEAPRLDESLAWLECAPWAAHEAGDHVILVGRVLSFGTSGETPLCFFRGRFLELTPQQVAGSSSQTGERPC